MHPNIAVDECDFEPHPRIDELRKELTAQPLRPEFFGRVWGALVRAQTGLPPLDYMPVELRDKVLHLAHAHAMDAKLQSRVLGLADVSTFEIDLTRVRSILCLVAMSQTILELGDFGCKKAIEKQESTLASTE